MGAADDVVPCVRHDFAPAPSRRRSSVSKGVAQRTAPGALGWCTRMQRFATRSIGTLYTNKVGRKRTDVSDPGLERGALHVYDRLGSTDADQLARLRYAGATDTRISVFGYSSPSPDVNGRVRDSASKANHGTFGSHGLWRGRRCPGSSNSDSKSLRNQSLNVVGVLSYPAVACYLSIRAHYVVRRQATKRYCTTSCRSVSERSDCHLKGN